MIEHLIARALPAVPQAIVQRIARRYVAGETLEHASSAVQRMNAAGAAATVDFLGEDAPDVTQTAATVTEYTRLLEQIATRELRSNVSLKLTALGLKLDRTRCGENLQRIALRAKQLGNTVRIDMEDHHHTDVTLQTYRELQPQLGNLGLVLQAMLHRTPQDIADLEPLRPSVRLCKGIYREPAAVAHQDDPSTQQAFIACLQQLFSAGCTVAIATHDEVLIAASLDLIARHHIAHDRYEFQTLLGVRVELRDRLISQGHRLRVYVPYGRDWYAYSLRRLRENPKVARHIMRAVLLRR